MLSSRHYDIVIIGGGLAGLTCALNLSKGGKRIALLEKYPYPRHKVCGEYVSNEILPYLRSLGTDPFAIGAVPIDQFRMTSPGSQAIQTRLPLGGFGISRFRLDNYLYELLQSRIDFFFGTINSIEKEDTRYLIRSSGGLIWETELLIGAYGKRSNLDKELKRNFIGQHSPWLGVKGHYLFDHPSNRVDLHHFKGGYCGISKVEEGIVNACYLVNYSVFKAFGSTDHFQNEIMGQNEELKRFLDEAKPVFDKPMTIAQISFQAKEPVVKGIPMIGDSAGLIHPLCGNGMAMAIHSSKILADLVHEGLAGTDLHRAYGVSWKRAFGNRLRAGRYLQRLLLNPQTNQLAIKLARKIPGLVPAVVRKTHGEVIVA
ncbi:NAD(P)/FAD-dependent oxidoreductase [Aureitalea marina]|uniref:FAD-dependent oxidoreductase n=1 Tax=Aureitalea marina TaxID=930804 RepID=A0A2S7KP31_9FLAO|nr:NAD(P)/FAD-dependent oxidoreductase [Aureitalea marina]PQB04382.1 hypothetical protein BST85_05325 [Aureitalea marina]